MLTGLLYDGGRLVALAGDPIIEAERPWQPIGRIVGWVLSAFGSNSALFISNAAWWIHNLVVLVFLNLLPLSKHFHIITGLPNVFFRKLEPTGALSKMDLENSEQFGTSRIDQFRLETDARYV